MRKAGGRWLRKYYGAPCKGNLQRVAIAPHVQRVVRRECVEAFQAFAAVVAAHKYQVRSKDTGTYNCRNNISGNTSPHAWGVAIDLNWSTNPATGGRYGGQNRLKTDFPPGMAEAIKRIRTKKGVQVFGWGGDYRSFKDAMHFEVISTPAELAEGIDWATVKRVPIDYSKPSTIPTVGKGDTGSTVTHLQTQLGVTADGIFGNQTEQALQAWQKARNITADGIAGPQTWIHIATKTPALQPDEAGPVKPLHYNNAVIFHAGATIDERLARALAAFFHYKVLSTDDDSQISIGTAYLVGQAAKHYAGNAKTVVLAGVNRAATFQKVADLIKENLHE